MQDPNNIGLTLQLAREKRGESAMDVSHRTRIPVHTIEALEINDYSEFSSPTYAKSFLAQYSEYLGVDADAWLDSFEAGDSLANLGDYSYLDVDKAVVGDREPVAGSQSKASSSNSSPSSLGPIIAFFIGVCVVGGGIYAFLQLDKEHNVQQATDTAPTKAGAPEGTGPQLPTTADVIPDPDQPVATADPTLPPIETDAPKKAIIVVEE